MRAIIVVGAGKGNQRGLTVLASSDVHRVIFDCVSMNKKVVI